MLDHHADIKCRRQNDDEYDDCLQIHNVDHNAKERIRNTKMKFDDLLLIFSADSNFRLLTSTFCNFLSKS